jgi:hypothetical protein
VASQPEVGPVHLEVFVAEHTPHAPPGSQAGVAPLQSASVAQPWQVCVAVSHAGVAPPHWALVRHPTQTPAVGSQVDVAPAQRRELVAEHWAHAPEG